MKVSEKTKRNIVTGAGVAVGAVGGAVAAVAATPQETHEVETETENVTAPTTDQTNSTNTANHDANHHHATPTPQPTPEPNPVEPPVGPGELPFPLDEAEVISYERVETEAGDIYDEAVLLAPDGAEVHVIDYDLDGMADVIEYDQNQDGVIDPENETYDASHHDISMEDFQEQSGFYAYDDDYQDYNNDANVDTYMA